MNLFHALLKLIHWISLFLSATFYGEHTNKQQKQIQNEPTPDPETAFCSQALARFQDTYIKYSHSEMNSNVDAVFYNATDFKKAIEVENNELELSWRRRQINLNTPRGNIIMFYDAFKLGFAYYSDQFMPYKILNAVAMRYVVMYRCRDLFIDENIVPENHKSGIIDSLMKGDDKKTSVSNKPFTVSAASQSNNQNQNQIELKETNRFINLGAVRNYNPLMEKKKTNPVNGFKSDAMPKPVMTYKQFKQQGIPIM